jgi:tRNA A37 methylthiotransferase MiaB
MDLQQQISAELNAARLGKVLRVLVDRKEGKYFIGRTEYDSPEVDQEVLVPVEFKLTPGSSTTWKSPKLQNSIFTGNPYRPENKKAPSLSCKGA